MEEVKEKKPGFFKRLEKSKKAQVLFFVVSMCVLVGGYPFTSNAMRKIKDNMLIDRAEVKEDVNVIFSLECHVGSSAENIQLSGSVVRINSIINGICLVFKDISSQEEIRVETETYEKKGINELLNTDWNFGKIGYTSNVNTNKLDLNKCYEILVYIDYKEAARTRYDDLVFNRYNEKITTGKFFFNGELFSYNPCEFFVPNILNEEMKAVIENGIVLAHDSTNMVWVYEYQAVIYFISKFSLFGLKEYQPEIPLFVRRYIEDQTSECGVRITQDYKGFYLTETEYIEYEDNALYICALPLPDKEGIIRIQTGIYHNQGDEKGWEWTMEEFVNLKLQK